LKLSFVIWLLCFTIICKINFHAEVFFLNVEKI
jgi:hypothetical protein